MENKKYGSSSYHIRRKDFFDVIPKAKEKGALLLDCAVPFLDNSTKEMAENHGYEYMPTDLEPRQPEIKKENIFNLSFEDKYFDGVICSHTLEHVVDYHTAIKELIRVVKDNGFIYLRIPAFNQEYNVRIYPDINDKQGHVWIPSVKNFHHDIDVLLKIDKYNYYNKTKEADWLCYKKV